MTGDPRRQPLWQDEFSVESAHERYVTRRQFAKFLVLTSLGMLAGNVVLLVRSWIPRRERYEPLAVCGVGDVPVGGVRIFHYPTERDACLLVRLGEDQYVAYSQKCTHLSCAVYFEKETGRLACPCHLGYFAPEDGRVLQGPPTRPLPRVRLERRGDTLFAAGFETPPEG